MITCPAHTAIIDDVSRTTYIMQVDRGAGTGDLNAIRNNLDMIKDSIVASPNISLNDLTLALIVDKH